jgi:hypothetical protein
MNWRKGFHRVELAVVNLLALFAGVGVYYIFWVYMTTQFPEKVREFFPYYIAFFIAIYVFIAFFLAWFIKRRTVMGLMVR